MRNPSDSGIKTTKTAVDFCVVGAGLAGICAAVSAARRGCRVALIHDRPVLGGNASSEVRMHVCGANRLRESGLVEEIELENIYRNPLKNYSIWDSILYEIVRNEPSIELMLNCSVCDATMDGDRIRSVKGWQTTTQTWRIVEASLFADCSGDSILAPLSGAEYRWGREASAEFNESLAQPVTDEKTMGMSCLIQPRETDRPQTFIPPAWANVYKTADEINRRSVKLGTNYWWLELGGEADTIHDTETIRDELLKVAFGCWDYIKNYSDQKDAYRNFVLDWVGFLPGKRESRRYVGDVIINQNDVRASGPFDDIVAYGGWPMDDHHPAGIRYSGEPTQFHKAPSPFGIPYRALYSRTISNLFCAGRNISATHIAMSSTRVMATCGIMGQAAGTAAAIAVRDGLSPRGIYEKRLTELQNDLLADDCYLPGKVRKPSALAAFASLAATQGDPSPLLNGTDRALGEESNAWSGGVNDWVEFRFREPQSVHGVRLVFDSRLERPEKNMLSYYPLAQEPVRVHPGLIKSFRIEADINGRLQTVFSVSDNHQRLVRLPLNVTAQRIRFVIDKTWGAPDCRVFGFEVF